MSHPSLSQLSRVIAAIGLSGASWMAHANVVFQEDFSGGNPVGATSYVLDLAGTAPGHYRVLADPSVITGNGFASYFDHTTGDASGRMMYFDGASDATTSLWSRVVSLEAGITYVFSYWLSAVTGSSPPVLAFTIDGRPQDPPTVTTGGTSGLWIQYSASFVQGVTGNALLSIADLTTASIGNDGAIDDLSLTFEPRVDPGPGTDPNPNPVPEPEQAALMAGGMGLLGWMTRRRARRPDDESMVAT